MHHHALLVSGGEACKQLGACHFDGRRQRGHESWCEAGQYVRMRPCDAIEFVFPLVRASNSHDHATKKTAGHGAQRACRHFQLLYSAMLVVLGVQPLSRRYGRRALVARLYVCKQN